VTTALIFLREMGPNNTPANEKTLSHCKADLFERRFSLVEKRGGDRVSMARSCHPAIHVWQLLARTNIAYWLCIRIKVA
jgi:hypothetical protein